MKPIYKRSSGLGFFAFLLLAATAPALAQTSAAPNNAPATTGAVGALKTESRDFLVKAIQGDRAEVELGKLAEKRAANAEIKKYGAMMSKDHGMGRAEKLKLADSLKIRVPEGVMPDAKAKQEQLMRLNGADFDQEYAKHMVADHRKTIAEYEAAQAIAEPPVKAMIDKTLPTLREHLRMAEQLPGAR